MESFRKQDMRAEQQLGMFMDEYFYSRIRAKDGSPLSFRRNSDKESQLLGVDVCIETKDKCMLIDEKASFYYSNAMIPTFAFELDSMQKGHDKPVEGWFVNDKLHTEYYMLIWPNVKCTKQGSGNYWVRKDIKYLSKDDFTIIEAMLIEKQEIRAMLEKKGFDKLRLMEYARRIREINGKSDSSYEMDILSNVKISFSGQIPEKPINLVIRKELLKSMAKGLFLISADGYAIIRRTIWIT